MVVKNIIKGWYLWLFGKKHPKWAKDRLAICNECPKNTAGVCMVCGCLLSAKTLVKEEQCHLDKWPKINEYDNEE